MAEKEKFTLEKIFPFFMRYLRPELRKKIASLVSRFPEFLKTPDIAKTTGMIAEFILTFLPIKYVKEILGDIFEVTSDELSRQLTAKEKVKEEITFEDIKKKFYKQFEEAEKKIAEAENIENEKERQIKIMEAKVEILEKFLESLEKIKTEVDKEVKEEKKVDWEKVFKKVGDRLSEISAKIREKTPEAYKKIDKKAEELADEIEKLRKKLRKTDLL